MSKSPTLNKKLMSDARLRLELGNIDRKLHESKTEFKIFIDANELKGMFSKEDLLIIRYFVGRKSIDTLKPNKSSETDVLNVLKKYEVQNQNTLISILETLSRLLDERTKWTDEIQRRADWIKKNGKPPKMSGRKMGVW